MNRRGHFLGEVIPGDFFFRACNGVINPFFLGFERACSAVEINPLRSQKPFWWQTFCLWEKCSVPTPTALTLAGALKGSKRPLWLFRRARSYPPAAGASSLVAS